MADVDGSKVPVFCWLSLRERRLELWDIPVLVEEEVDDVDGVEHVDYDYRIRDIAICLVLERSVYTYLLLIYKTAYLEVSRQIHSI